MTDEQTALIARIEAATGADNDFARLTLNAKIWEAVGLTPKQEQHCTGWCRMNGRTDLTRRQYTMTWAPNFVGSLDAAASLAPDVAGICWGIRAFAGDKIEAWVWNAADEPGTAKLSEAATAPLALCLAALRARWAS